MSAFNASAWIGNRTIRPTAAQLTDMAAKDTGFYQCGMDRLWRNAGYFALPFRISTAIDANTKRSPEFKARFPFKVVAVDVAVESAAGTTCTADIEKNPAGTPDTYATMSTGAVDVKTLAGEFVNLPVLNGSEDVGYDDQLQLVVAAGGSGAVVGGCAILHCFRL